MKTRFVVYVLVICAFAALLSSCGNDDGNNDTLVLNSKYFNKLKAEAKEPDVQWLQNHYLTGEDDCYNGPALEINDVQGELCLQEYKQESVHHINLAHYNFIGTDAGEFGGGIICAKYDGQSNDESPELVLSENCLGFLGLDADVPACYAFTGIAHMGIDRGGIYKIELLDDGYAINKLVDLGSEPLAFAMDGQNIIVATKKSLVSVDETGKITELFVSDYWEALHVNSMLNYDEYYYFGTSSGILKFVKESKTVVWYPYHKAPGE